MALQATQWLLAQNWTELSRLFQNHQPNCAEEYGARALLKLYLGNGSPEWPSVIGDMRQACEMKPADPLLSCNLAQALLDTQQAGPAYQIATATFGTYPNSLPAMEKHVLAAVAMQRWPDAYRSLVRAKSVLGDKQRMPGWAANLLTELSLQWWIPLEVGGVVLRIPNESDAGFLKETFRNAEFMQHYHRFQGSSDKDVESFIARAKLSPRRTGRLDWVILDRSNACVGLFAFVDIDWRNDRGEVLIGIPRKLVSSTPLKAAVVAIKFAFERMGLRKIVSYVYADNPNAQINTLHYGFVQEGLLRSHINSESGRLDIFVNGMTPADLAGNRFISGLARKWMPEPSCDRSIEPVEDVSMGRDSSSGLVGGDVNALATITPLNAGTYYLGVRGFSVPAWSYRTPIKF